jgi:cardiolipin synthase
MSIRSSTVKGRFTLRNRVRLLQSGQEYFEILESLIRNAAYEIHLQTYILATDGTGNRIIEALLDAARRKVRIYILVDAYGSQKLSTGLIRKLVHAGIRIRKYGRFYSHGRFHIGRRLHHKVTVIDGFTSIVGGINISDNYNNTPLGRAWLDFAVLIEGDASRKLQMICHRRWSGTLRRKIDKPYHPKSSGDLPVTNIQVRRNDFILNLHEAAISYRQGIRMAEKSILIIGGYFLPGGRTRRLLRNAVRRGVDIRIVTAEKSDVTLLRNARRYLYRWLTDNGMHLYNYDPANVHGKIMIVDNCWMTIGSYDLNNLSTYSNIELNVDIDDTAFSRLTTERLEKVIAEECTKITAQKVKSYGSWWNIIVMWISYRIVKTFFVLSVILAGRRKQDF